MKWTATLADLKQALYARQPDKSENLMHRRDGLVEQHSTIAVSQRRKLLKALIEENGWSWHEVIDDGQPSANAFG